MVAVRSNTFPGGLTSPQQWLDGLLPKLPGATADMIKHEVLTIAREFFQRSTAWRAWCGPILMHPDTHEYEIETTDIKANVVVVHEVVRVETGDRLAPLNERSSGPRSNYAVGEYPTSYFCPTPDTITFLPVLQDDGTPWQMSVFASLKPIDLDIPEHLVQQHYNAICDGVLANLYLVPGLNFKPDLGMLKRRQFLAEVGVARTNAQSSFTAHSTTLRPAVPFATGQYRGRGQIGGQR